MKISPEDCTSPKTHSALEKLDELEAELLRVSQEGMQNGVSGCAEVTRAIELAAELREMLAQGESDKRFNWERITFTLHYLLEVVKTLGSFINYQHPSWSTMNTGSIIKRLRKSELISQSELAEILEISRTYLSQIENSQNQASLELLKRIAAHFEVPVGLLLAWEDNQESEHRIYMKLQELYMELLKLRIERGCGKLEQSDSSAN